MNFSHADCSEQTACDVLLHDMNIILAHNLMVFKAQYAS